MVETLQTYDVDGAPLELVPREIVHRDGLWHRAVSVFLFRSNGQLLVQRRSTNKDVFPDVWDLSVAEHLLPRENYADAAHRGLSEELSIQGVVLEPLGDEIAWKFDGLNTNIKDYEFQQCFSCVSDDAAKASAIEVADIRFVTIHDLKSMMRRSSELFTPWFVELVSRLELFADTLGSHE